MKVTIQGTQTSVAGGHFAVVDENGTQIASVKAVETHKARATSNNSYDRHRIAKGDVFNTTVEYFAEGDIEATCKAISEHLPQPFKDARFGTSWFKHDATDFYAFFNFLRAISGKCGWYGNTPSPVVKKIKSAWKKGVTLEI